MTHDLRQTIVGWKTHRPRLYAWVQRFRYHIWWNSVRKQVKGRNNRIVSNNALLHHCVFDVQGHDNHVFIGCGAVLRNVIFRIRGNGHRIHLGSEVMVARAAVFWMEGECGTLEIGDLTTIEEAHLAVTENGRSIKLGHDCMLAYGIEVRTGDSHSVLDAATARRINPPADVVIGDHVWIAAHVLILKGCSIGKHSIIGTGAVVTKADGLQGVIYAGNPARIIKNGITWDRKRLRFPDEGIEGSEAGVESTALRPRHE